MKNRWGFLFGLLFFRSYKTCFFPVFSQILCLICWEFQSSTVYTADTSLLWFLLPHMAQVWPKWLMCRAQCSHHKPVWWIWEGPRQLCAHWFLWKHLWQIFTSQKTFVLCSDYLKTLVIQIRVSLMVFS